jgi:hypothetical protein
MPQSMKKGTGTQAKEGNFQGIYSELWPKLEPEPKEIVGIFGSTTLVPTHRTYFTQSPPHLTSRL